MAVASPLTARLVPVEALDRFVVDALRAAGAPADHARATADALVTADTWGTFTHGTKLLIGYLRRLRFSTIKVDRSFVQGAATGNPESLAIIRAVVAMADSLEMSTTAEGVETEAELAMVRELGCRKIQGFYFGRPMTADDAIALFRRWDMIRNESAA